jgi:hypothetical protein
LEDTTIFIMKWHWTKGFRAIRVFPQDMHNDGGSTINKMSVSELGVAEPK